LTVGGITFLTRLLLCTVSNSLYFLIQQIGPILEPLGMKQYIATSIGRLRVIAFLEGISLIVLVFAGVPMKYYFDAPSIVKIVGPVHGVLFLFYIAIAMNVAVEQKWRFWGTTWKVLLASIIPFGTFYVDSKILRNIKSSEN
jgi:integral membrane protein